AARSRLCRGVTARFRCTGDRPWSTTRETDHEGTYHGARTRNFAGRPDPRSDRRRSANVSAELLSRVGRRLLGAALPRGGRARRAKLHRRETHANENGGGRHAARAHSDRSQPKGLGVRDRYTWKILRVQPNWSEGLGRVASARW